MKLKKRPERLEMRKRLRSVSIDLFPADKILEDDDGEYINSIPVPSPTLAEVVRYFKDMGINFDDVKMGSSERSSGCNGYFYFKPRFEYTEMESMSDYEDRCDQYKIEMKEYKDWYKENKEKVKAAKAVLRAQKEKDKVDKSAAAKKARLFKMQEKLKKELAQLG